MSRAKPKRNPIPLKDCLFVSVADAAVLLGNLSDSTVRKYIKSEGLPVHRVCNRMRISVEELKEWVKATGKEKDQVA